MDIKLSVVLATRNEEENIARCLASVKDIADEIIIFDEESSDNTVKISERFGAKVYKTKHEDIFHVTKQKAIDKAKGKWILQLDADEVVSSKLAQEIANVINLTDTEILNRKPSNHKNGELFDRHLSLLEKRDGAIGKRTGEVVAFFVPRVNMFLGKALIHGGVYPDGVIRLIKKGKAYLPGKSVHEQMVVNGEVSWLFEPLEHWDSPTLKRYIDRLNRYTDLHAKELDKNKVPKDLFFLLRYSTFEPFKAFLTRYVRHVGYKDGMRGFLWAIFSAWHYPIAYYKYFLR